MVRRLLDVRLYRDTGSTRFMVNIRLKRIGKIHKPFFHIVAIDHRMARDGRFLEKLGHYDPAPEKSLVTLKEERIRFWWQHGAQVSGAVKHLLKIQKIDLGPRKLPA